MPVSKKRKKEGKKVKRSAPAAAPHEGEGHPPSEAPNPIQQRMGKPSNPFLTHQPNRPMGSQRGR